MGASEIRFFSDGTEFVYPDKDLARKIIDLVLKKESTVFNEVNLIFCGDKEIRDINKEFLRKNNTTDVIAFTLDREQGVAEVYIGVDQVKRNSKYFGETFENEINRVLIHGLLHLCGYTDYSKEEKDVMREKENHYLQSLQ